MGINEPMMMIIYKAWIGLLFLTILCVFVIAMCENFGAKGIIAPALALFTLHSFIMLTGGYFDY